MSWQQWPPTLFAQAGTEVGCNEQENCLHDSCCRTRAFAIGELCGVHLHSPAWWPLPFGYDIFFGFFGCWLLIILAKIIMTPLLQRDETYYDDPKGGEDDE